MKVIAVVGTKKTGKTTLVEALVRSLAKHGKVGTVKNMVDHPVDRGTPEGTSMLGRMWS